VGPPPPGPPNFVKPNPPRLQPTLVRHAPTLPDALLGAITAKAQESWGGGAVQECAEPGMAEPKPHRDVLRRLLNGTPTPTHNA
jgi:hypothetical protein